MWELNLYKDERSLGSKSLGRGVGKLEKSFFLVFLEFWSGRIIQSLYWKWGSQLGVLVVRVGCRGEVENLCFFFQLLFLRLQLIQEGSGSRERFGVDICQQGSSWEEELDVEWRIVRLRQSLLVFCGLFLLLYLFTMVFRE